jgi:hypothetical protein
MYSSILTTLKALHYSGDRKNFMFDKFGSAHVEQHNRHAALAKFKLDVVSNEMRIHYFQEGIKGVSSNIVKGTIMTAQATYPQIFTDFDPVMNLYMTFKHSQRSP